MGFHSLSSHEDALRRFLNGTMTSLPCQLRCIAPLIIATLIFGVDCHLRQGGGGGQSGARRGAKTLAWQPVANVSFVGMNCAQFSDAKPGLLNVMIDSLTSASTSSVRLVVTQSDSQCLILTTRIEGWATLGAKKIESWQNEASEGVFYRAIVDYIAARSPSATVEVSSYKEDPKATPDSSVVGASIGAVMTLLLVCACGCGYAYLRGKSQQKRSNQQVTQYATRRPPTSPVQSRSSVVNPLVQDSPEISRRDRVRMASIYRVGGGSTRFMAGGAPPPPPTPPPAATKPVPPPPANTPPKFKAPPKAPLRPPPPPPK